ncbi:MAG TPA: 16S rRNA (guanine(966)-N(2))-methyltransferase RsmD [Candidatus Omnitrophica bacterium]|nr:MAG: 16S rRNA (guanine(966)-N(2))-methyltransferase RsmD [Omnitrophica WOR_2 bacterium GWA2_45_18]OGX18695.1 MAG: 16S rRNA (guanine(966)-N(2))-methyltransferase RsmD [Omnitrophica WOR_2 bacterium GWC2_45_7]HBR15575.1 16S rRNA (guanine(966)-N(2))-methyltransferase RsmD [Candidatus Omnitrophota bacterium]
MKIIGGTWRGRNFYTPLEIRPTQGALRKALFDILGQELNGMAFLDLFAGSGAVGLEALSRGARKVVFVEKDERFAQIIGENLRLLNRDVAANGSVACELRHADAFATIKLLSRNGAKFDLIYVDPSYGLGLAKKALKTLEAYDILAPNCLVIIEHNSDENLPKQQGKFLIFRQKEYANSILTFYKIIESAGVGS